MNHANAERAITAANQFTDKITVTNAAATLLAMCSAMVATLVLQIRPPTDLAGAAWADDSTGWVDAPTTLTAAGILTTVLLGGSWQVRAGCKTGAFTSATDLKIFLRSTCAS